ncbi:MAG TPA: ATP-binding protein [Acidimicrobiales bacterium]|nr:ATP-binding protein [Acidimicrobiales bacterium]
MCRKASFELPGLSKSVPAARRLVADEARGWGVGEDVVYLVALLTSELTSNAVRFSGDGIRVELWLHRGSLEISVEDRAGGTPAARQRAPWETSGRGLEIVDTLSQDWGVRDRPAGKTVWSSLAVALPEGQGDCPDCACEPESG